MGVEPDDAVIAVQITDGTGEVFIGTRNGKAIRFEESEVRPMGRQARGVRAMDLDEEDFLIGLEVVEKDAMILSIAENGFGKRTPLEDYRLTHRGGKGVINMKTTKKTGNVVALLSVKEDSELIIVSQNGKIIRIESSTIRQAGRSTQGVIVFDTAEDERVVSVERLTEEGAEE